MSKNNYKERFDEEFPHSDICQEKNKELGEKAGLQFGKLCMCQDRVKILDFVQSELLSLISEIREEMPKAITNGEVDQSDINTIQQNFGEQKGHNELLEKITSILNHKEQELNGADQ